MPTYAIGDLQGCLPSLRDLLKKLAFDPDRDRLWLVGDLVSRGPESLETLRFVRDLGEAAVCVLGNHDLHLLAIHAGVRGTRDPGLAAVIAARDRDALMDWLRTRPLLPHDPELDAPLVHAGIFPAWTLDQARARAAELHAVLAGDDWRAFLDRMYGNLPDRWSDELEGWDRLRFICNSFTRMRYLHPDGRLNLADNGAPGTQPRGDLPWFDAPARAMAGRRIVFGHWSTLGLLQRPDLLALDTGCVWGGRLTAARLDKPEPEIIAVDCPGWRKPG